MDNTAPEPAALQRTPEKLKRRDKDSFAKVVLGEKRFRLKVLGLPLKKWERDRGRKKNEK